MPKNITHGIFILQVDLTYPNVEYLANLNAPIIVESEGVIGVSGINFNYSGSGLLML